MNNTINLSNTNDENTKDNLWESEKKIIELMHENSELKKQLNCALNLHKNSTKDLNANNVNMQQIVPEVTIKDIQMKEGVSEKHIEEYVDKLMQDKNISISYLPTFVERKIYINTFTLMMNLLNDTCNTTILNFMGHQMKMEISNANNTTESSTKE